MNRIVVLGMHRGGTSLAAEMVQAWGAFAGDETELMHPDPINPRGYFEHWPLVHLNEELLTAVQSTWYCPPEDDAARQLTSNPDLRRRAVLLLERMDAAGNVWFWKDPRLAVLLPFWQSLWGDVTYVIALRDPLESATSILRRDGYPVSASLLLWQRSMTSILRDTAPGPRRIFLRYERALTDPGGEAGRLARALDAARGRPAVSAETVERISRVVDPALRRSRARFPFLESRQAAPEQKALYCHCLAAAADRAEPFHENCYPLYPGWREYLRAVVDLASERQVSQAERSRRTVAHRPRVETTRAVAGAGTGAALAVAPVSATAEATRAEARSCVATAQPRPGKSILDAYVTSRPDPQHVLDIFRGEWSSALPQPHADCEAGKIPLFEDPRVAWWLDATGGVRDRSVLELGPLEAGHTYMLHQAGAREILAIEANTRAYLKCLAIKELLELKRARFLCGDFVEWLRLETRQFDQVLASGVLYHMQNPVELISLLSSHCSSSLMIWTHYYDDEIIRRREDLSVKFPGASPAHFRGFEHTLYRQEYQASLDWVGFCGGSAPGSAWLSRDDLFAALEHFGLGRFRINFDDPNHPHGPALALIAERVA